MTDPAHPVTDDLHAVLTERVQALATVPTLAERVGHVVDTTGTVLAPDPSYQRDPFGVPELDAMVAVEPTGHQPPALHEDGCGSCDLYAAQMHVADKLDALTAAVNTLGGQVQWLTNGTMGLFEVIHSIGPDLKTMSLGDKIALMKQMMGA